MNRKLFLSAFSILTIAATSNLTAVLAEDSASKAPLLVGNVVIVGDGEDAQKTSKANRLDINPGGLLVVQVHDQGSAPVDIMKTDGSHAFQYIGEVRGVKVADGKPLMGGGYKWALFKVGEQEGPAEINVTFKSAPHAGGKTKTVTNYLTIVANEE